MRYYDEFMINGRLYHESRPLPQKGKSELYQFVLSFLPVKLRVDPIPS